MFFLNLSALEFFTLLSALGGLLSVLYLLDRSKRRKVVSTLRFWTPAKSASGEQSRKRVQDPWSFVLQLAALLFLLLAIAQLQWGSRGQQGRAFVLLLDSSIWSAQQQADKAAPVLDQEKTLARSFVHRLGAKDRALVARVNGIATPVTSFTSDKQELLKAVAETESTYSALNLAQTFEFARRLQMNGNQGGVSGAEVVYIGPGMAADDAAATSLPDHLRVVAVPAKRENSGLTGVEVHRDLRNGSGWLATVTARNFGAQDIHCRLEAGFDRTQFTPRNLTIPAGHETQTSIRFSTSGAGVFKVRLQPGDSLAADDAARLGLPDAAELAVAVFTDRPQVLQPLLDADHRLSAHLYTVGEYVPDPPADVVVLDSFDPPSAPSKPSLWINPPKEHAPLRVKETVEGAIVKTWHAESGISTGLHARETAISSANVFEAFQGDVPIASVSAGPVVVARKASAPFKPLAAIGFDPLAATQRYEVTTPLLIAHLLDWLAPEQLREREFAATPLGPLTVMLDSKEDTYGVRVLDERGANVPFTLHDHSLSLFANQPSVVRVITRDRERVLSMTLPALASYRWTPRDVPSGFPPASGSSSSATDLWEYLAIAAAACLALEWRFFGRRRRTASHRWPLGLKIAGFAAIAIALFQPHIQMPTSRTAALILVDTSKSIPARDLDRASDLVSEMSRSKRGNWLRIIPFSSHARELRHDELLHGVHFMAAANEEGDTTNFEAAISDSLPAIPSGYIPRIVLMSDGNDNQGSTARVIAGLQQLHIPVDTIPLTGRTGGGPRLLSVSMPKTAYSGEQIPVDLRLEAPAAMEATVSLSAGDKQLGSNKVSLQQGGNDVRLHARINTTGATAITADVNGLPFEGAVTLNRARVLLISGDSAESDTNLVNALSEAGFEVNRSTTTTFDSTRNFDLLVLNNLDLNGFSLNDKTRISEYVRRGGGLLLIGGEHQVYKEDKKLDALDEALPAKLAPPKTPEGTCVALIIDKSSSMEGRKIELARLSAIGVVDHLRSIDTIGVLIFDNSFQWAVPMRKAEDKALIKRLIFGIVPDGGTQIAPALTEAYRKVEASNATYKHIVLMTDGISEEGDSLELARQALDHQVTISTVGLGQDVNRSYLEKVADVSGGKSYFLNEPQGLEQILLKDVQDYSGSTAVEKTLTPIVDAKAEILEGLNLEAAPALRGYVRFISKPDAETILSIDPQKKDPLYVRWQYGLGRAAIFTSDAKSRWAQAWVTWPGYDKFWINISRDLLPHLRKTDADINLDVANSDLVVTYKLSPEVPDPVSVPQLFALGPGGFQRPVAVNRIADHLYQGRVHVGEKTGLFRVRPLQDSEAFPETGYFRQNAELHDFGTNEQSLKQIAALTGGRFNPPPHQIFDSGGRTIYNNWQLWPLMLALAIALTLAELVVRKWSGLSAALHLRAR